jgi:hypothetical protein
MHAGAYILDEVYTLSSSSTGLFTVTGDVELLATCHIMLALKLIPWTHPVSQVDLALVVAIVGLLSFIYRMPSHFLIKTGLQCQLEISPCTSYTVLPFVLPRRRLFSTLSRPKSAFSEASTITSASSST